MRLSFISPLIVILMGANSAFANREEPIISPQTGGQPFLLTFKDSSKKSKRDPGVYLRDQANGDWKLLIPGNVLVDNQRGAAVNMLKLQEIDNRLPTMAVVDGKIRIWTLLSNPEEKKSFLTLGEDGLVELGSGARWQLPEITSADQLSVAQFLTGDRKSLLLLISIKNPAPSPIGQSDGLTVALTLDAGDSSQLDVRGGRAVIVDQKFRTSQQLNDMAKVEGNQGLVVFSESLEYATLNQWEMMDFGDYNPKARAFVNTQRNTAILNVAFFKPTAARWNISKQQVIYNDLQNFELETEPGVSLRQRWNLMGGNPTVQISQMGRSSSLDLLVNGRLRLNSKGQVWTSVDPYESRASVFAVEQDFYLATSANMKIHLGKFRPNLDKVPERSSLAVFEREGKIYALFSYGYTHAGATSNMPEDMASGRTDLLVFQPGNDSEMHLERTMKLTDSYYSTSELRSRLVLEADRKSALSMDVSTPAQGDKHRYLQARKDTSPHLDLIRSTTMKKHFVHTVPTATIRLTNNLVYREFEFSDGDNPNGIYEINDAGENVHFIGGHLLHREGLEGYEILGRTTPYQSETLGSINAVGFLVDRTYREGKVGSETLLDFRGTADRKTWKSRLLFNNHSSMTGDLIDVRLMNGSGKRSSDFWLLQFSPDKVWIGSFSLIKNGDKIEPSDVKGVSFQYDGHPQKFMEQVVYSSAGEPYVILTPEISPDSREFQVASLRTGQAIYPKRLYGNEALTFNFNVNAGDLFQAFNEHSELSWKVQPFQQAEDKRNGSVAGLVRNQLFAKFTQYLSEAADPKQPKRRRILLVPEELKTLAADFVRESYLVPTQKDAPKDSLFHRFNRKLSLYLLNENHADANAVFENFEMASKKKDETSVIVAGLDQLLEIDRPVSDDGHNFILKVPYPETDLEGKVQLRFEELTPHILYLMAAGAPVEYETFREKLPEPRVSTMLIGTRDELTALQSRAEAEMSAGLDKAFEIVELPQPTLESKAMILEEVMNRPAIKGLGFDYDASGVSDSPGDSKEEQRRKLFEYAITRIDALASERSMNSFSAFAKFEEMYLERIISDPIVRNTRVINRAFVERILKAHFNLALNLADLPENDPRKVLSREDAVIKLHRAGLLGEFELKAEIIRLILAQLNHDPSRNMPASWIFAGEPGTGKSKSWDALVKALNLTLYKIGQPNPDANAFYLDTVHVKKGDAEAVKRIIRELNTFVTSEKGSTGFIFIDDLSFADDALGSAIVQWIRSLQQAAGGLYRYTNDEGNSMSVSVRNLTLGMAMNFTDNKNTLSQFSGNDVNALVAKIVATGNRFGMDKSFVDRFGGVFNFDKFHQSVKEPALNDALLNAAKAKMRRLGQFVVADPALIREASQAFPDLGARPFLSKVTEAILGQPDMLQGSRSKIFAIVPKTAEERAAGENLSINTTGAWGEQSTEVKAWVSKNARVIEIDQSPTAALVLMRLMIPSFRSPIMESLVYAIQTDPRYTSDRLAQSYFLSPALLAVVDHMDRAETIPLKDLKLDETQLGVKTQNEREEFKKLLAEMSAGETPFVVPFPENQERLSLWSALGVNGKPTFQSESRNNVLRNYRDKIEALLEKHLMSTLNIQDLSALDNPENWLRSLPEAVPDRTDELGRKLNDLLFAFARDFQSPDLREAMGNSPAPKLDPYVSARFFLMTVDQAIARLPWSRLSQKMMVALQAATHDLVLGQSVGVQNWLFNPEDHVSLLKPATTNLIREIVEFNSSVREVGKDERRRMGSDFSSNCEKYLESKGGI